MGSRELPEPQDPRDPREGVTPQETPSLGPPAGVFAVQCPNPRCRKFMLVEEPERGQAVVCLVCKTTIRTESLGL